MKGVRRYLPALTLLAAGVAGSLGVASSRWRRASAGAAEALMPPSPGIEIDKKDYSNLPPVVEKYLRRALPRPTAPSSVRIDHEGEFLLNGTWRGFRSTEVFSVEPRGFVWDARIRIAPFLDIFVRDSSIAGMGSMQASIVGLVPVVNERGGGSLNEGALQRYLAEAPWLPAALLPRFGVTWEAMNDTQARAAVRQGDTSISLEFTFNDGGDVTGVYSPARPREVRGRFEPAPWAGRFGNYQERCGMRIPLDSEVEWIIGGTPQPYFRGRIAGMEVTSRPA